MNVLVLSVILQGRGLGDAGIWFDRFGSGSFGLQEEGRRWGREAGRGSS